MRNADFRQLALLCELLDTQSLKEAASRMAITPSAANQSLNRLKNALGDPLFIRQGSTYQLTPYGETAVDRFRHLVRDWREVTEGGNAFSPVTCEERLSIALSEAEIMVDAADLYARVATEAPGITLDIHAAQNSVGDIINLRSAQVDLVCTHLLPPPDASDLHSNKLGSWRATFCCLNVDHPRIGAAMNLDEYLREVHLVTLFTTRKELESSPTAARWAKLGRERRVSLAGSLRLVAEIISRTDRIVTCTEPWAKRLQQLSPGIRCVPLPAEAVFPESEVHLVWHQRTHHSAPHRWLRECVRAVVAKNSLKGPIV